MEKSIAVIGAGYWGKNLVRNFWELGALSTVCDAGIDRLQVFKSKYPDIKTTSSFKEVLKDEDIKGVVIATPAVHHYQMTKEALLSHKDVFVEKPLALKISEGEELVSLAKEQKRILMVGHILQYHPAVIKLKEMIEAGELGKIQYIYSNRLNIGKLRTEENILWSFAPHDISVILMLLNEEPIRVTAFGGRYITEGVYDTTLTTLEFKNGIRGHIFVSWLHPYKEQKLIVVGTKAMAVFDDVSKEKLFIYPHKIDYIGGKIPIAQKVEYYNIPLENKEPLKEELKHFIECINERKQPQTDGEEGLRVLRILEKAERYLSSSLTLEHNFYQDKAIVHPHPNPPPSRERELKNIINKHSPSPGGRGLKSPIPPSPGGRGLGGGGELLQDKKYFVHESSFIDEDVQIGEGTKIWHFSHILKGSIIGKNCIIGHNVVIGPDVTVGNRCKVQNNVSLYKGVILEDEVFCGPSCVFTNVYNPRAFIERKHEFRNTLVKKGTTIGANATIVCGVTIGKYAMLGAGAVVKSDVPDNAIVAGVPAKQIGWACKCGTTLDFKDNHAICSYCGSEYSLEGGRFIIIKEGAV